jgi:hypothetical protein
MIIATSASLPVAIGINLLIALEERGVAVRVDPATFDLVVTPAHLLSESEAETIARNIDGVIVAVVLNNESGARVRRRVFATQPGTNLLVPDAPYQTGLCFSCGAESAPFGRRPTRCLLCRAGFLAAAQDS